MAATVLTWAADQALRGSRRPRYDPTRGPRELWRAGEEVKRKAAARVGRTGADREHRPLPGRVVSRAAELKQAERRLRFALEAAQVGIFDWHVPSGRTVYVAPRTDREGLGYREIEAEQSEQIVHPEDQPALRAAIEQFLSGENETLEVTRRSRTATWPGEWVHISVHGKAVERSPDGRPVRVLGIYRNVTEEIRQKNALRRREAAVTNASRLASLGELASIVAHELNQPLAALTTYVQATTRLVEVGEASRRETVLALRRCVALAERASEILKRVRRLVRRLPPIDEAFDLRDSVADMAGLLEAEARDRGVEIRLRRPRGAIVVRCDRVQVEQAIFNLCRNAIEALAGSTRRRRLVQVAVSGSAHGALVRVSDNGPGIPKDLAKDVFEPFVSTKAEGSGLGLSVSKSIAEAQGGSLRLERSGPRGAAFVLRLSREKRGARGATA